MGELREGEMRKGEGRNSHSESGLLSQANAMSVS